MPAWVVASSAGLMGTVAVCAGLLWWWGRSATARLDAAFHRVVVASADDDAALMRSLQNAGLIDSPALFSLYQRVWHPFYEPDLGAHWVNAQTPEELLTALARSRSREVVRVTLPEGWDSFQMAERLASSGVCDRDEFLRVVLVGPTQAAERTESQWSSFEGRLYPASYEFRIDTAAEDVVARLVGEADKRHRTLFESHQAELIRLGRDLQFGPQDVVTLASIVEKEAANEAELPLVASVFLNRLRDPDFRPAKMLQSDPTAAYGCKREPTLGACRQYSGKVTPPMLRDATNPFNSYRHAGLPPTPIGNPSTRAIAAVLTAPTTEYLFFVSPDGGPHRFSMTLDEHERHLR